MKKQKTGFYHTGKDSYEYPEIKAFRIGYEEKQFGWGPFKTFDDAKKDFLALLASDVELIKYLTKNVKRLNDPSAKPAKIDKKTTLTDIQIKKILSAAASTWQAIEGDARAVSKRISVKGAIELILDCDRISSIGRLDPNIVTKAELYGDLEKILKANSRSWFA